jgi:hypothetical protein
MGQPPVLSSRNGIPLPLESRALPPAFVDLEPFADRWCLATESERYAQRLGAPMDEMLALYDAILPRLDEALSHCNLFPLTDMPEDAERLLRLLFSFVMVSFPVEVWSQARIPDVGDASLERVVEPGP